MDKVVTIFDKLAFIGCQFTNVKPTSADLEETIAEAIETLPFSKERGRILKVLCSWIAENGRHVIVEKLSKILTQKKAEGANISYAALLGAFALHQKLHNWKVLLKFKPEKPLSISDHEGSPDKLATWAENANFILSNKSISPDQKFTLNRTQIANYNLQFRNRLIIGAQYRADIVTLAQIGITSVSEVVKLIGVSREPASRILLELHDAGLTKAKKGKITKVNYLNENHKGERA